MKKIMLTAALLISGAFIGTNANATIIDLTTEGSSGSIDGALFQQEGVQPAGTGVIKPFLRIQANGTEEGYNTDGPYYMDEKAGIWTHLLDLSDVATVDINGTFYREFLLDINEVNSGDNPLLSLDQLKFALSDDVLDGTLADFDALTPVWDLDNTGDNWIKLNYDLEEGSGVSDMFAYIPDSLFTGGSYVYLYSQFGINEASDAGFEEWATHTTTRPPSNPVPEPGTILLFGTGLAGLAGVSRRKKKD